MQPTKVGSFSEFVELFGDTVPESWWRYFRDGNLQSPMYGTYAAKAFLVSNVAPLTYIRVLGEQKTGTSTAEWKTSNQPNNNYHSNGGAYGLWLWPSTSMHAASGLMGAGSCAVWYLNSGSTISLSGTLWGTGSVPRPPMVLVKLLYRILTAYFDQNL